MERRNFLKILPIAAIAPKVVADGVVSLELPAGGHYVIVANMEMVDIQNLAEYPRYVLPKGATGGFIIGVMGNPDDALKFYKLEEPNVCVQS